MGIGDDLLRRLRDSGDDGLRLAAQAVLEEAQRNIPVGDPNVDPDPNVTLRDSGRIEEHGDGFIISFNTPYAAKVHEDQRLKHPRGGQAKYLERALTTLAPTFERIVASRVEARMAKGLASDPRRSHR